LITTATIPVGSGLGGFIVGVSPGQIRSYQAAVAMRLSAWLASTKLTLLPRSSSASRTTDGEGLPLAWFFFHGGRENTPEGMYKNGQF